MDADDVDVEADSPRMDAAVAARAEGDGDMTNAAAATAAPTQPQDDEEEEEEEEEDRNDAPTGTRQAAAKAADAGNDDDDNDDDDDDEDDVVSRKQTKRKKLLETEAGEDEDADDDEDGAGASSAAKKKKRLMKKSRRADDGNSSDDDEDDDNMVMTEEDRKFIAGDDEVDAEVVQEPKRRRDSESSEGEMDEEDLEIANQGKPKQSRLRKKKDDLTALVENDDDDADDNEASDEEIDDMIEETDEQRKERISNLMSGQRRTYQQNDTLGVLQDIFGSEFAGLQEEIREQEQDRPQLTLRDVVEPAVLEERMRTLADAEVLAIDMPERLQPLFVQNGTVPDPRQLQDELAAEQAWIMTRPPFKERQDTLDLEQSIPAVIKCLRGEYMEIPFIYHYRRDYFDNVLSRDELWRIQELDSEWRSMRQRLSRIQAKYDDVSRDDAGRRDAYLEEQLAVTRTDEGSKDLQDYFELHLGHAAPRKRRGKLALYHEAVVEQSVLDFVKLMSITARQFGENLTSAVRLYEPEDPTSMPEQLARDHITAMFRQPRHVVIAARAVLAGEIAHDPQVRRALRDLYADRAAITVRPTRKGKDEIDRFHPLADIKYLTNKPIVRCEGPLFLRLMKAEKEGLLVVKMSTLSSSNTEFFNEIRGFLVSDRTSQLADAWNAERTAALMDAVDDFLGPMLQSGLRARLEREASEWVIKRCQETLERQLMVAPFQAAASSGSKSSKSAKQRRRPADSDSDSDLSSDDDDESRVAPEGVLAISWMRDDGTRTSHATATMGALLSADGEVKAVLRLENMRMRIGLNSTKQQQDVKQKDLETLRDFIIKRKPAAVVVGTTGVDARFLFEDLERVLNDLRAQPDAPNVPQLLFMEDEVAVLYGKSERARKEFLEFPALLHYCISLGRRLLNPLAEFAGLASRHGNDMRYLRLHPLQHYVPQDVLMDALERTTVDVVASVGVDINKALRLPHLGAMLPFVPGLGYRRAFELTEKANTGTFEGLQTRTQLVTKLGMLNTVFINCCAFICVKPIVARSKRRRQRNGGEDADEEVDVLDRTRVHVESYTFARRMAADALGEEISEEDLERSSAIVAKLQAMDDAVARLSGFNREELHEYADKLRELGDWRRVHTLQMLQRELGEPFKEVRRPFEPIKAEDLFDVLSGETEDSLYPGLIVQAEVTNVKDKSVSLRLDSGLTGVIYVRNLSDERVNEPREVLSEGAVVSGRVISLIKDRFLVELTIKPSDMHPHRRTAAIPARRTDPDYDDIAEQRELDDETSVKNAQSKKRVTRNITHEFFRNYTYLEAEESLAAADVSAYVVRPSSKGPDYLSITVKMGSGLFLHLDVRNADKEHEFDPIGRKLYIESEAFDDLDEVLSRYVQPIGMFMQDALSHRKFFEGPIEDLDARINAEKDRDMSKIPYYFCQIPTKPTRLQLAYRPGMHVKHEYIHVTPNGFRFRFEVNRRNWLTLDELFGWFKNNMRTVTPVAVAVHRR